jgi:hypothetical protein
MTTSTVTFSRPMIRPIHSPLNTLGAPQSKPSSVKKPDCLVEVVDDKSDVDEVGDAGGPLSTDYGTYVTCFRSAVAVAYCGRPLGR